MRNSNLKVLGSTFMTLIKEKVRVGASEEEVMDLLTKYQNEEEVVFSDKDFLELIIEMVRAGKTSSAEKLAEMLPKNRGFYQEMRNHIPDMIRLGETEIPYQLVHTFSLPAQVCDHYYLSYQALLALLMKAPPYKWQIRQLFSAIIMKTILISNVSKSITT